MKKTDKTHGDYVKPENIREIDDVGLGETSLDRDGSYTLHSTFDLGMKFNDAIANGRGIPQAVDLDVNWGERFSVRTKYK